jgi:hypothetical protein
LCFASRSHRCRCERDAKHKAYMESLQSSKLALNVSGNVNPNWGCNNPRAGAGTFGTCAPIKRGELVRM